MAQIAGVGEGDDVIGAIAKMAELSRDHFVIENLQWLGLFETDTVPDCDTRLDVLSERLLERLKYRDGERDMLILKHTFVVENADRSMQTITSTLIDYGIPGGDSSMARTVSLPLARRGLLAANILGFTRAVGEFGAIVTVAGNIPFQTQTLASASNYGNFAVITNRHIVSSVISQI